MVGGDSMAICNARTLAAYVSEYYKNKKGTDISAIKLQKSLYFLFAYWGGFIRKAKMFKGAVEDEFYKNCDEYLFDDKIEAWAYGPVVPCVYREKQLMNYRNDKIFEGKEKVKEFVDGIIDDLINVSEFSLVEISHKDLAWKRHFNPKEDFFSHNETIPPEDIISEYSRK